MTIDCGECNWFHDHALHYYQDSLRGYGFSFVQCRSEHGGRECSVMYECDRCRLLFLLSDGAEACLLAAPDVPFPGSVMLYGNGDYGWYHIVALIEFKSGKQHLTEKLSREFFSEQRVFFAWESQLFADWADVLLDMFAPGKPQQWRDDFERYIAKRNAGY